MMEDDLQELLVRYILNETTPIENIKVKELIEKDEELLLAYTELYEIWHGAIAAKYDTYELDQKLSNIRHRMRQRDKPIHRFWLIGAAGILLVLSFGLLYTFTHKKNAIKFTQLSTAHGLKRKIILPDGTQVWLNGGTTFRYPTNFGKESRTVYLSGEAFFKIGKKHGLAPFVVKSMGYTVRDIGTAFNVRAYPQERKFVAAVIEGEIMVQSENSESAKAVVIHVRKQDILTVEALSKIGKGRVDSTVDVSMGHIADNQHILYDGWKSDKLIFTNNTFAEVALVLEKRFDVKIRFTDTSIINYKYSGDFNDIQNIEKALDIIKLNTPISYRSKNGIFTLYKTTN